MAVGQKHDSSTPCTWRTIRNLTEIVRQDTATPDDGRIMDNDMFGVKDLGIEYFQVCLQPNLIDDIYHYFNCHEIKGGGSNV